ncbi:uncharacterized protein METZ01_LOCUS90174 [marine metagenome]|uniref:Uncharacterized protein n=1 Tax=marine metagenome TaxID=408172 RepID=A0A381VAE6_9ZZZZ|tara:strand:- start:133 stop:507 length:375 start_codon:yes stop_codon:yes gene_type:complete
MSDETLFESRLSTLEKDNRRLKLALVALLLVLASVSLVGAIMPEQAPQVITARQFRVIDATDVVRVSISNSGITYYDRNGTRRSMVADAINYWDENNAIRVLIGDPGIIYVGEDGNVVWRTPER